MGEAMIQALGEILYHLFAVIGLLTVPVAIGAAMLRRSRRAVTMAGRQR